MGKLLLKSIVGMGLLFSVLSLGTVSAQADSFEFVVHLNAAPPPPPPPRDEVRWAPPTSHHVWIAGHWGFDNQDSSWVWHSGYYDYPPVPWAKWHSAYGRDYHGEYYWVKGHWDY